jgi:ComF family protein
MRRADTKKVIPIIVREAFKRAADLILPFKCPVCGGVSDTEERFGNYDRLYTEFYGTEPELHICGKCLSMLDASDEDKRWFLCLSNPVENDPCPGLALYMPFPYKGIPERAVPAIKFGKNKELARLFGTVLGSFLRDEGIRADLIVPIPLSEKRLAERGFNQAYEIAYPVSRINSVPVAEDCLIRTRDTGRQSEIHDSNKRAGNVRGAFEVNSSWDVTGLSIVIVDDVATTGATLHEAALVLYKAGAAKVLCVAFAGNRMLKNAEPF